jgi:hypothetical protein
VQEDKQRKRAEAGAAAAMVDLIMTITKTTTTKNNNLPMSSLNQRGRLEALVTKYPTILSKLTFHPPTTCSVECQLPDQKKQLIQETMTDVRKRFAESLVSQLVYDKCMEKLSSSLVPVGYEWIHGLLHEIKLDGIGQQLIKEGMNDDWFRDMVKIDKETLANQPQPSSSLLKSELQSVFPSLSLSSINQWMEVICKGVKKEPN